VVLNGSQAAFELLLAGSQLLSADSAEQAETLLRLLTVLQGPALPGLVRWLLPQRRAVAERSYRLWAAIAGVCRPDQVYRLISLLCH